MGLPGIYDSIEEMAADIEVDSEVLTETIKNYNDAVRGEREDEFGRTTFYKELVPPYYVVKVSNGVACTTGGLTVDTTNQVLDANGVPIENLYAVGEIAGGMLIGYIGGESLANASITGMLLGQRLSSELAV